MKTTISTSILFLLAAAAHGQSTDRNVSVPDAVPACMERNGPDCVLKSDMVAPRIGPPTVVVAPPATPTTPPDTSGAIATTPTTPRSGLVGGNTVVVTPNTGTNSTSTGFTTNPNSIGGNLQSSGGTTGTSTSSGFTTNPNSVGGALQAGPASTPATNTTGAGSVRR